MGNGYLRNILLFYLLAITTGLSFIYDLVIVIYYQSFGLTFTQIGLIVGITGLSSLMMEIPTGAFADIYGRKKSIAIGSFLLFTSFLIFIFSSHL